jgi:hypothetical protein
MFTTTHNPFDTELDLFRAWLRSEGDGGDGGSGDGGSGDGGDGGSSDGGSGDGDTGKGKDEKKDGGKKDEKKDDFPWDEHNRLKREASERAKNDREREQEEARKRGEHEKVAANEKKRADEAEAERDRLRREQVVTAVAARVGMIDPTDAAANLSPEEMEDEASAERALERLRERKGHLFSKSKTGADDIDEDERRREEVRTGGHSDDDGEGPMGLERLRGVKRKDT